MEFKKTSRASEGNNEDISKQQDEVNGPFGLGCPLPLLPSIGAASTLLGLISITVASDPIEGATKQVALYSRSERPLQHRPL
ncbi:hypothetical protein J6590_056619 [Homalodisca vitripennis]|nr:hypothetical protein J6590_056619 [Homalodisca vitripennis]